MTHNSLKEPLKFYVFGIIITAIGIGFIHLYSFLFESFFCYAEVMNIIETCSIGGVGFGISIWAFKSYFELENSF